MLRIFECLLRYKILALFFGLFKLIKKLMEKKFRFDICNTTHIMAFLNIDFYIPIEFLYN